MTDTRLQCLSPEAARTVADEAGGRESPHCARVDGSAVILTYTDPRYPLNVAEWAFDCGHASDEAAAALIGRL